MSAIVFIGDEISAVGFRLAGVSVRVPLEGEEEQDLSAALSSAELVLITEGLAGRLDAGLLRRCQAGTRPIVGVVPDVASARWPLDLAAEVRRHLGIEAGDS